jgi:hypothetical protein
VSRAGTRRVKSRQILRDQPLLHPLLTKFTAILQERRASRRTSSGGLIGFETFALEAENEAAAGGLDSGGRGGE